jgi:hypothetical protein
MTYRLGKGSLNKLGECDIRLQQLALRSIEDSPHDFGITCGHRDKAEQDRCCDAGLSKTPWPTSKHNSYPAKAFDFAVYKGAQIDWKDEAAFRAVAHHIQAIAKDMGIKVRWGGDFNRNGDETDDRFVDLPHIELDEV